MAAASALIVPSRYLARIATNWGIPGQRIHVVPNPPPSHQVLVARRQLRERFGLDRPTIVFAGRFVEQKNVGLAISALRHAPGRSWSWWATVPSDNRLQPRSSITGSLTESGSSRLDQEDAMAWMRAADAVVLPSEWENYPHAAVESLVVGTPVIATEVSGVPEIVRNGVDGMLVAPGDEAGLGSAMAMVANDGAEIERLRRGE